MNLAKTHQSVLQEWRRCPSELHYAALRLHKEVPCSMKQLSTSAVLEPYHLSKHARKYCGTAVAFVESSS